MDNNNNNNKIIIIIIIIIIGRRRRRKKKTLFILRNIDQLSYKKKTAGINLCAVIKFFKIKKVVPSKKSAKADIYNKTERAWSNWPFKQRMNQSLKQPVCYAYSDLWLLMAFVCQDYLGFSQLPNYLVGYIELHCETYNVDFHRSLWDQYMTLLVFQEKTLIL